MVARTRGRLLLLAHHLARPVLTARRAPEAAPIGKLITTGPVDWTHARVCFGSWHPDPRAHRLPLASLHRLARTVSCVRNASAHASWRWPHGSRKASPTRRSPPSCVSRPAPFKPTWQAPAASSAHERALSWPYYFFARDCCRSSPTRRCGSAGPAIRPFGSLTGIRYRQDPRPEWGVGTVDRLSLVSASQRGGQIVAIGCRGSIARRCGGGVVRDEWLPRIVGAWSER